MRESRRVLLAPEHRVGGPPGAAAEFRARHTTHLRVEPDLLEDRLRELGPGRFSSGCEMPDAEWALEELARRGGEMPDVRRRYPLVGHDIDLVTVTREREHRANEVRSPRPEQSGGAGDPRALAGSCFAVQLRPPIDG